jgi:hypothetical protein
MAESQRLTCERIKELTTPPEILQPAAWSAPEWPELPEIDPIDDTEDDPPKWYGSDGVKRRIGF